MGDIQRVLRQAAVRIGFSRFLTLLVMLGCVALVAAIVARLAEQMFGVGIDWKKFAYLAPISAVVLAALGAVLKREKPMTVAQRVDTGGDLKESLSTALAIENRSDAWADNVRETARRAAVGVNVKQAVPIEAPRWWPAPLALALSFVVLWIVVPPMDLLGKQKVIAEKKVEAEKVETAAAEAKTAVDKAKKKLDDAMKALGEKDDPNDPTKTPNPEKPTTPEEIKRAAVRQLTAMKDKLEAMKLSQKALNAEAMSQKMKQLRQPGDGKLDQFAQALAQGKMGDAQQALAELSKSMSSGSMSQEDQAKVQKQMENLAKQLEKLAADKKALEQKLAKAGLDPKLANSPSALAEALKNNQSMSQQQKDQMQKQADAQESASQNCQGMAQAASKMADAMKQGQMGQQGAQAMQQMQQAMNQMEMAQADQQSLEAAMSECQQQLSQMSESSGQCNNPGEGECAGGQPGNGNGENNSGEAGKYSEGETSGNGSGRGGPGVSQGGTGVGEEAAAENFTKRKAKPPLGAGPMIGTMLVQGEQIKGESKAALAEMAANAEQQATEAMNNNQIRREFQSVVKKYFSTMVEKTKDEKKPEEKK